MVASVIRMSAATDAADCSAVRVTLTGSLTPMSIILPVVPSAKLTPSPFGMFFTLSTTTEPSKPAFCAMARIGASMALRMISTPTFSSASATSSASSAGMALISATPPPATMPSSTAARVACRASSMRDFFSLSSASVAAPTFSTATPPDSFARRSCSFSRSKSESTRSSSFLIWLMRSSMACFSPAPSTIRAASLETLTVLAVPSISILASASVMPKSLSMTCAPVTAAMSSRMRLRRSPKPGALMATQLNVPRSLFSRMVARASPSTSSATMNSGRPDFMMVSSSGTMSWMLEIFWSVSRMNGSDRTASIFSMSVAM